MKILIFPNITQSARVFIDASKYDHIIIETWIPHTPEQQKQIIDGLKQVIKKLEKEWRKTDERGKETSGG